MALNTKEQPLKIYIYLQKITIRHEESQINNKNNLTKLMCNT